MTAANLGRHSALPAGVTPAQTPEQIARAWATNPVYTAECRNCGRRHTVRLTCSDFAAGRPGGPLPVTLDLGAIAAAFQAIKDALLPVLRVLGPALQRAFDVFQSIHDGGPAQFHRELKLAEPCPWCPPDRPEVDHGGI